jgi:hypothetical protein
MVSWTMVSFALLLMMLSSLGRISGGEESVIGGIMGGEGRHFGNTPRTVDIRSKEHEVALDREGGVGEEFDDDEEEELADEEDLEAENDGGEVNFEDEQEDEYEPDDDWFDEEESDEEVDEEFRLQMYKERGYEWPLKKVKNNCCCKLCSLRNDSRFTIEFTARSGHSRVE